MEEEARRATALRPEAAWRSRAGGGDARRLGWQRPMACKLHRGCCPIGFPGSWDHHLGGEEEEGRLGVGGAVGLGCSPKKATVTPAGSSELDGLSVLEERGTVLHVLV